MIMTTYSGNLIAFLAIDKHSPPFETLHHLANQEEFSFGTLGGSGWLDIFQVKHSLCITNLLYCRSFRI